MDFDDDTLDRQPPRSRNHKDPLSPFRWFIQRATARVGKLGPGDLTPEHLQQVWRAQQGICPITGWGLYLPASSRGFWAKSPRNASLDRKDNARGYLEGNVRFVALIANLARSDFTDLDVVEFAHAVSERHSKENIE